MMNDQHFCKDWAEKLAARHREDLTIQEQLELQKHLHECPSCSALYQAYQSLEDAIRAVPVPEPLPSLLPTLRQMREKKRPPVRFFGEGTQRISAVQEGRRLALLIGIDSVARANIPALHYAERDAQELATMLQEQVGAELFVPPILGKEATRLNILNSLHYLACEATATNDEVILYFAGHSFAFSDGDYHLVPYDWDGLEETALPVKMISELFQVSRAKSRLVILDCCHSGVVSQASLLPFTRGQEHFVEHLTRSERDDSPRSLLVSMKSQGQREGSDESESLPARFQHALDKDKAMVNNRASSEIVTLQQIRRSLEAALS